MFYHARVVLKRERAKEAQKIAFESDQSREDLLQKIAIPFVEGKQFFCGGMVVQSSRVEEVKFNCTQQSAKELLPFIRARRRSSNIVTFHPEVWEVIWEGDDITRELLDEASRARTAPTTATTRRASDRVFLVHGHDTDALDQTELLIRRFGLTPIILRDSASGFGAHQE